jgi:uracil-DNA glycosylase family 4
MGSSPAQADSLSKSQRAALAEMGIDVWVSRRPAASAETIVEVPAQVPVQVPVQVPAQVPAQAPGNWAGLNESIRACTRCELHAGRTQAVCGVGNTAADWLVVGEAPGADEDEQGEPFVGRAGQLLNEMLRAAGQPREQVFIANILKCRPPNNRDPKPAEVDQCLPYLQQQIEMVRPKLILVVGRIAAHNLLKVDVPIGKLRGQIHHYGADNIPVVVTYHPAYLLRSPSQKRKSWDDLMLAMDVAAGSAS